VCYRKAFISLRGLIGRLGLLSAFYGSRQEFDLQLFLIWSLFLRPDIAVGSGFLPPADSTIQLDLPDKDESS
jgi:hypothetical protein